jgi:hypothetical protein
MVAFNVNPDPNNLGSAFTVEGGPDGSGTVVVQDPDVQNVKNVGVSALDPTKIASPPDGEFDGAPLSPATGVKQPNSLASTMLFTKAQTGDPSYVMTKEIGLGQNTQRGDLDVMWVQARLQKMGYYTDDLDGDCGPHTLLAIFHFQRDLINADPQGHLRGADEMISPDGPTHAALLSDKPVPKPAPAPAPGPVDPTGNPDVGTWNDGALGGLPATTTPKVQLQLADFEASAQRTGLPLARIRAVFSVEASGRGFFQASDGRWYPNMLFESGRFGALTNHQFNAVAPNLSTNGWVPGNYGAAGEHQAVRLDEAMKLGDGSQEIKNAGLESTSYGLPQILGENFKLAGYSNVHDFVGAMCTSEALQLQAFETFMRNDGAMSALMNGDYEGFARRYNGPGQVEHYAQMIEEAEARFQNA